MSYSTLILGESGTGKTCSLRNLDPQKCLLIQPVRKPLPFRSAGWKEIHGKNDGGNIYVCADPAKIVKAMLRCPKPIVIVDDFQYILTSLYMNARNVKSYEKFSDIGGAGYDICMAANSLSGATRVYVLAHTQTDDMGNVRIKTLGRMLDEKIVIEGLFTNVLRTKVDAGRYLFRTHNSGQDTVKTGLGMFADDEIENDLALVDKTLCEYYGIEQAPSVTEIDAKPQPVPATNASNATNVA